jgi:hypothetical protein
VYGVSGEVDSGTPGNESCGVQGIIHSNTATTGSGVFGRHLGGGYGVYGQSSNGCGVYGESTNGQSTSGYGVYGFSTYSDGVHGVTATGSSHAGVSGYSPDYVGTFGSSVSGYGVWGSSPSGDGVYGTSTSGRGGVFSGGVAAIQLVASSAATHPAGGSAGDLFVDSTARLWFCKGGTTWVELAPTTLWSLAAGWNLVSIAQGSLAASQALQAVLGASGGTLAAIYQLSGGHWSAPMILRKGGTPTGTPFTLVPGAGYLLYTDKPASVSFAALDQASSAPVQPGTVNPHGGDGTAQRAPLPPIPSLP